jgi:hypothetical protein
MRAGAQPVGRVSVPESADPDAPDHSLNRCDVVPGEQ